MSPLIPEMRSKYAVLMLRQAYETPRSPVKGGRGASAATVPLSVKSWEA